MPAKVDTNRLNAMFDQLAKLTGAPFEKVVTAEVGKVLEQTVKNTKAASVQRIRNRYKEFVPMGQDAFSPKRIRRSGNLVGPNLIYYMGNRYPRELWQALQVRRQELINRKRAARGLAKKSWSEITDALGLKIEVADYVRAAVPSTGKQYNNVATSKQANAQGVQITISNAQPTVNAIGGAQALKRAIAGRVKYFEASCQKAVFADQAKIARQYPGITVKAA